MPPLSAPSARQARRRPPCPRSLRAPRAGASARAFASTHACRTSIGGQLGGGGGSLQRVRCRSSRGATAAGSAVRWTCLTLGSPRARACSRARAHAHLRTGRRSHLLTGRAASGWGRWGSTARFPGAIDGGAPASRGGTSSSPDLWGCRRHARAVSAGGQASAARARAECSRPGAGHMP
jgi:hypothetical protein